MVFSSFIFVFAFLPIALAAFHLSRKFAPAKVANTVLILFSLYFYAFWKPAFLPIILISIAFNYGLAHLMYRRGEGQKALALLGVAANVLYLGVFKYLDFVIENTNAALSTDFNLLHIALPLGISFFTFQQITYIVDIYRRERPPGNIIDYCLFVTFFPQLIAGPIVHHKEMMPQFEQLKEKPFNPNFVSLGLFVFTIGLAKKVLIADKLAPFVNRGFSAEGPMMMHDAWLASLGYTFQLYFDFSGYAAMAVGLGLLFGIRLPINFNSPYKAVSIQDFWRRWHITLSRFLRDYIYIPLGGNRVRVERQYINLFLTFFVGGIWHGAAWTFVIWGALHGLATVVHRFWTRVLKIPIPIGIAWAITFLFAVVTWVFFRADSVGSALDMLRSMTDTQSMRPLLLGFTEGKIDLSLKEVFPVTQPSLMSLAIFFIAIPIALLAPSVAVMMRRFKPNIWVSLATIGLFLLSLANMEAVNEFLYFDF